MGAKQSKGHSTPEQLVGAAPAPQLEAVQWQQGNLSAEAPKPLLQSLSQARAQRPRRSGTVGSWGGRPLAPLDAFNDDDGLEVEPFSEAAQPEPDPDTSAEAPVILSTRVEYASIPRGQTQDVFGLVTIQAAAEAAPGPAAPAAGSCEEARQSMDIVCVLDVSGSMNGDKIRQVQDAQRFIVGQMTQADRLGLVAFESTARRELRLRRMNAEGKDDANVATLRLQAGGGTSIAAGLHTAVSVMEQRRQRNKVSAIMLLTDGKDGRSRAQLPALLERVRAAGCSLYVFGFGADHDAAMLSEVAEQARTPFTYVEDTENIKEAFAGAVGGLASIVAQGLELRLDCRVPLKAVNTPFSVRRDSGMQATVSISDLMAGERRDILLELAVPAQPGGVAAETVLLEATMRYTDLRRNCAARTPTAAMEAQRTDEPQPELEPDEEVTAQRERFEVTRALQEAASRCDADQMEEASRVLDAAEHRMQTSKKTKFSEALGQELEDARGRMRSRSMWESGGRAEVLDAAQMHSIQRCTNTSSSSKSRVMKSSKAMYLCEEQSAWIERSRRG